MDISGEFSSAFFEESSKQWLANKIRLKEGCYEYKKNAFPYEDLPRSQRRKRPYRAPVYKEKEPPQVRRSARLRNARAKMITTNDILRT